MDRQIGLKWWHKVWAQFQKARMVIIVVEELVNAMDRIASRLDGLGNNPVDGQPKV